MMKVKILHDEWKKIGRRMGWSKIAQDLSGKNPAEFKLPMFLRGAKPKYGYSGSLFDIQFNSDWDKASFILHSASVKGTPSKSHDAYVQSIEAFGLSEAEAVAHGAKVKEYVKSIAKEMASRGQNNGIINVPSQG
jgi:hypothetical protein